MFGLSIYEMNNKCESQMLGLSRHRWFCHTQTTAPPSGGDCVCVLFAADGAKRPSRLPVPPGESWGAPSTAPSPDGRLTVPPDPPLRPGSVRCFLPVGRVQRNVQRETRWSEENWFHCAAGVCRIPTETQKSSPHFNSTILFFSRMT